MKVEPLVFPVGRIGSESEPPNLAAETIAECGAFHARNPRSPVRLRQPGLPKPHGIQGVGGSTRVPAEKSLQPQTSWRWNQSVAN
jgi:hypothetical protein